MKRPTAKERAQVLDMMLTMCSERPIENEHFYSAMLPDNDEVVSFLISEGMVEQDAYNVKITYKGRIYLDEGGFVGHRRRKIFSYVLSIFTAICALVGVVLQFVFQ